MPNKPTLEICKSCKFAQVNFNPPKDEPNAALRCCIRAPIAYSGIDAQKYSLGIWPAVRPDGWCAEWKEIK